MFKHVKYSTLNARQKEIFNFQKIAAALADCGFNCIKLADDWQGADFLAYEMNGDRTIRVQLKSRITIDAKYQRKDIWIAFPHQDFWYLVEHDALVQKVGRHTNWLESDSWQTRGIYHSASIKAGLLRELAENKIGPVYGPLAEVDD